MKKMLFGLILGCLVSPSIYAGQDRGGGNGTVAEFMQVARETLNGARSVQETVIVQDRKVKLDDLSDLLEHATIVSVETPLSLEGRSVDAINTPSTREIEISLPGWSKLSPSQKAKLSVHELLGLARVPDQDYLVSSKVVSITSGIFELSKQNLVDFSVSKYHPVDWDTQVEEVCPDAPIRTGLVWLYEATVAASTRNFTYRFCTWPDDDQAPFQLRPFYSIYSAPEVYSCVKSKTCDLMGCTETYGSQFVTYSVLLTFNRGNQVTSVQENRHVSTCQ